MIWHTVSSGLKGDNDIAHDTVSRKVVVLCALPACRQYVCAILDACAADKIHFFHQAACHFHPDILSIRKQAILAVFFPRLLSNSLIRFLGLLSHPSSSSVNKEC